MRRIIIFLVVLVVLSSCLQRQVGVEKDNNKMNHEMEMEKENISILNISLTEWAVEMENNEIEAGKVMFHIMNNGITTHDLHIMNSDFASDKVSIKPGEMKMMTLELKPGKYDIHCPIIGHTEKGMFNQLVVK